MPIPRLVERPAFEIVGQKTWIPGQDNAAFGRFWQESHASGLLARLTALSGQPGPQTGGVLLGVSCVEADPANRAFYYYIAVERPVGELPADLETHAIPATTWAVFEAHGPLPDALVASEMYAFGEWLPASGYVHAAAPEMEVYPPREGVCEFWLPVVKG